MTAFDDALAFVLEHEGGYADVPGDRGGETYKGVSRIHHPDWEGWPTIDAKPHPIARGTIFPELEAQVAGFYREHYWSPIGGDQLPPRLALTVFDWAVHSGVSRALIALQMLVGAPSDGKFGPKTLGLVTEYMDRNIARDLLGARSVFLERIGKQQPQFAKGWDNRIRDLAERIA